MSYRRLLIRIVTFLGGIYFFLEFVLPPKIAGVEVGAYSDQITKGFVAIGTMAVGLGVINLLLLHGSRLLLKRSGWPYSAALLAGLFLMLGVTSLDWRATSRISNEVGRIYVLRDFSYILAADQLPQVRRAEPLIASLQSVLGDLDQRAAALRAGAPEGRAAEPEKAAAAAERLGAAVAALRRTIDGVDAAVLDAGWYKRLAQSLNELAGLWRDLLTLQYQGSATKRMYALLYDGLYVPLGAAMFSLLGFYIATAAYRAFRIRSAESALMMTAALIVMLGQIPFGVWIWDGFPEARNWLLKIPSAAAFRAITFGAAIAGLVMAFRMWFSIESEGFGEKGRGGPQESE